MSVAAIGAAVGAAAAIGGVGLQASSSKKQQGLLESQAAINNISNEQLTKAQMAANDRNTRIKIVADSVANLKASQNATAMQVKALRESAKQKNIIMLTIGGAVIVVASAYVITKK